MGLDARSLLILLLIALLLFGAAKLPALARSLGRSARILKSEAKGLSDEEGEESEDGRQDQRQAPRQDAQPQEQQPQQDYRQQYQSEDVQQGLPPGQRIVNENGEPVRRYND